MEEVAFLRGGRQTHSPQVKPKKDIDDNLFKIPNVGHKKKRKQDQEISDVSSKKKKFATNIDDDMFSVPPITVETLVPGMLIMGCIQAIKKYEMIISLPNSLLGSVSVVDISSPYTLCLKTFAESSVVEESKKQAPAPLKKMFSVGSYVVCKIKAIDKSAKTKQPKVILTLNPRELYDDIIHTHVYDGMFLSGAVESVEEHGYVMDVGIKGVTAFLKQEHAKLHDKKLNKGRPLSIGQLIFCVVSMKKSQSSSTNIRVLELSAKPATVSGAMPADEEASILSLVPGTLISINIEEVMPNGLCISFGNYKGVVLKSHMEDQFMKPEHIIMQEKIKGRILCIHPLTKLLYVSLQKRLTSLFSDDYFGGLRIGDHIEDAEIIEIVKNNVCFRLLQKCKGIAKPSMLSVKKHAIRSTYPIGSTHHCVVKRFNAMDNIVMVSLRTEDIEKIVYDLKDLKPGDLVECQVSNIQKHGTGVAIEGGIWGFIPLIHAREHSSKGKKKAYKLKEQLLCRVLKVNIDRNLVILSNKDSIVSSKLPVIASFKDAAPNMIVEGCVSHIGLNRIALSFYNGVEGQISIQEIDDDMAVSLGESFKLGQLVRCMVLSADSHHIWLTMKLPGESSTPTSFPMLEEFPVGKIYPCKVSKVTTEGLIVELIPSGFVASLPMQHLSDHLWNCQLLLHTYKVGDVIERVLCFSKGSPPLVTMKQIFIDWVEKGDTVSSVNFMKPGMVVPAVIKNISNMGIFVNLLHDMKGLIPLKNISNQFISDPSALGFQEKQSLLAEVEDVDELKRITLSIKPKMSQYDIDHAGVDDLKSVLQELEKIRQHFLRHGKGKLRTVASHTVGSFVDFTVQAVNEYGAVGLVGTGIKGLSTVHHLGKRIPTIGETVQAMVIGVDYFDCILELLVNPTILNEIAKGNLADGVEFLDNKRVGTTVLNTKPDYTVVFVRLKASFAIGYLPSKTHFNDMPNIKTLPLCGKQFLTVVKSVSENIIICNKGCKFCRKNGTCKMKSTE